MSGTLPTTLKPAQATLKSTQPTRVSVSHSLKRQARTDGVQRWSIRLQWPPMLRVHLGELFAFLLSQRGQADTFTTTLQGQTAPQGSWAGSPVVNGASQTGSTVALSGFTASQTNVVKAGDLLKFAGHTKVYMATADASSNASGQASVAIMPALVTSPANGEAVVSSNVPFTVALTSDNLETSMQPGVVYGLAIDLVEVY